MREHFLNPWAFREQYLAKSFYSYFYFTKLIKERERCYNFSYTMQNVAVLEKLKSSKPTEGVPAKSLDFAERVEGKEEQEEFPDPKFVFRGMSLSKLKAILEERSMGAIEEKHGPSMSGDIHGAFSGSAEEGISYALDPQYENDRIDAARNPIVMVKATRDIPDFEDWQPYLSNFADKNHRVAEYGLDRRVEIQDLERSVLLMSDQTAIELEKSGDKLPETTRVAYFSADEMDFWREVANEADQNLVSFFLLTEIERNKELFGDSGYETYLSQQGLIDANKVAQLEVYRKLRNEYQLDELKSVLVEVQDFSILNEENLLPGETPEMSVLERMRLRLEHKKLQQLT